MEFSYLLNQMCQSVLTDADVKAISKARGFSLQEVASRGAFESYFLSSIGVEAVMAKLSQEEIITLHLLSQQKTDVPIDFFDRLYGVKRDDDRRYQSYLTYTQQFKPVLDKVKAQLVRKGILVIADVADSSNTVLIERWRFCFPPDFVRFLPPLIPSPLVQPGPAEVQQEYLREKIFETSAGKASASPEMQPVRGISLVDGTLRLEFQPFRIAVLLEWQQKLWTSGLKVKAVEESVSLPPHEAVRMALSSLAPGEWASVEDLEPVVKILCFQLAPPPVAEICQKGWTTGCLGRSVVQGKAYYRLFSDAEMQHFLEPDWDPGQYLSKDTSDPNGLIVDYRTIPFKQLEQLNCLIVFKFSASRWMVVPDAVKLGRSAPDDRRSPLAQWLAEQNPAFKSALEKVNAHWGKTILHSNLLTARVRDLSLRVQLERELADRLVVLDDEFVAFPVQARPAVEKIVKKAGFVIKEVHR